METYTSLLSSLSTHLTRPSTLFLIFISLLAALYFSKSPGLPSNHPPHVPYSIPWLGSAIPFFKNQHAFMRHISRTYPDRKIHTLLVGGRFFYIVLDAALASQIFKSTRLFAFEPLALQILGTTGCPPADVKILSRGAQDPNLKHAKSQDSSNHGSVQQNEDRKLGLVEEIHRMGIAGLLGVVGLRGPALDRMTSVFISQLESRLICAFPPSGDWQDVELISFIGRHWTLAAIGALWGTEILKQEGEEALFQWVWDFDRSIQTLMTGLPDWLIWKSARSRENGLGILGRWERRARRAEEQGLIKRRDDDHWDEFWGLTSVRERTQVAQDHGLSERARNTLQMDVFWALSANMVPTAAHFILRTLFDPALMSKLLSEVSLSLTPETPAFTSSRSHPSFSSRPTTPNIDLNHLSDSLHISSFLQEIYRYTIAADSVRVTQENTNLGTYTLLRGGTIIIPSRSMQLDPSVWGPDAPIFNPSRFLPETSLDRRDTAASKNGEYENKTTAAAASQTKSKTCIETETEPDLKRERKEKRKLQQQAMRHFGGGQNLCPGRHFAKNAILGGFVVFMNLLEVEIVESSNEKGNGIGMGLRCPEVQEADGKVGSLWPVGEVWARVRSRRR